MKEKGFNMEDGSITEAFGGLVANLASVGKGIVGTTKQYEQIDKENDTTAQIEAEREQG